MGFDPNVLYERYELSPNPVDILSTENTFLETDFAPGMISEGERTGRFQNSTMDSDPGYYYIENFRGGIQWCLISRNFISIISSKEKGKWKKSNIQ